MLGRIFYKMLTALSLRRSPPPRESTLPADDDFVARYGLSYGKAGDPISKEAHQEIERLKTVRMPRR